MKRYNPGLAAGVVAIVALLAALLQLIIGLQTGGIPPETILFAVIAIIFAALWRTLRQA